MKLLIAGSRGYEDYSMFCKHIKTTINPDNIDLIISGGAKGVDSMAVDFAKQNYIEWKVVPPDWDQYGKKAGMLRNTEMVREADQVLVFWDGKSRGTADTIKKARTRSKLLRIIRV